MSGTDEKLQYIIRLFLSRSTSASYSLMLLTVFLLHIGDTLPIQ